MKKAGLVSRFLVGLGFLSFSARVATAQKAISPDTNNGVATELTAQEKKEWLQESAKVAAFYDREIPLSITFTNREDVKIHTVIGAGVTPEILVNSAYAKRNHKFKDFLVAHETGHHVHYDIPENKIGYGHARQVGGDTEVGHDQEVEKFCDSLAVLYAGKDKAVAFLDMQALHRQEEVQELLSSVVQKHPDIAMENGFIRVEMTSNSASFFEDLTLKEMLVAHLVFLEGIEESGELMRQFQEGVIDRLPIESVSLFTVDEMLGEIEEAIDLASEKGAHGSYDTRKSFVQGLSLPSGTRDVGRY